MRYPSGKGALPGAPHGFWRTGRLIPGGFAGPPVNWRPFFLGNPTLRDREQPQGFPVIGPLFAPDAERALQDPVKAAGVQFTKDALAEIVKVTQGYPYFLQEWGYQAWNRAATSPIARKVVEGASATVIERLDENFFRVRFDRCTPAEKRYLRAMAGLGPGAHRSGDIATELGVTLNSLGPVRAKLIKKGMIYSPAHGDMAFTVPLFDEFMMRAVPNL